MNKINDLELDVVSRTRELDLTLIARCGGCELRRQSRDCEILQTLDVIFSSCISGHLDVSPCHAVIICHTPSPDTRVSARPSHVQPAVKYLFCPELQQIFTAFVKF